jgi:hypothetical protein
MAVLHVAAGLAAATALSVTHATIGGASNPHLLFAIVGFALGVFGILFMGGVPKIVPLPARRRCSGALPASWPSPRAWLRWAFPNPAPWERLGSARVANCRVRYGWPVRETWSNMGDKLCDLAKEDEARGRLISAGEKFGRAATYYVTAERLQAHGAPGRLELYRRVIDIFNHGIKLAGENCERVEIPYGDAHISGLYVRAEGVTGPAPILVQVNGLDSTKEMKYRVGLPQWLAKRGVASLVIDQPGTGEALRLHGRDCSSGGSASDRSALRHQSTTGRWTNFAGPTTRRRS